MIQPTSSLIVPLNTPPKIHQKSIIIDNAAAGSDAFLASQAATPDQTVPRAPFFARVPALITQSTEEICAAPKSSYLHSKELTIEPKTNQENREPASFLQWAGAAVPCVDLSREFSDSWGVPPTEQFFSDPKLK